MPICLISWGDRFWRFETYYKIYKILGNSRPLVFADILAGHRGPKKLQISQETGILGARNFVPTKIFSQWGFLRVSRSSRDWIVVCLLSMHDEILSVSGQNIRGWDNFIKSFTKNGGILKFISGYFVDGFSRRPYPCSLRFLDSSIFGTNEVFGDSMASLETSHNRFIPVSKWLGSPPFISHV